MESLQAMQNKAARLGTYSQLRTSRKEIYSRVCWLTINQLVFYYSALSTFRIRQTKEPEYLSEFMNRNNRAGRIIIPNSSLTLAKVSYCFRGSSQWNCFQDQIRNSLRISQFKSQLKNWILQNVPQFIDS